MEDTALPLPEIDHKAVGLRIEALRVSLGLRKNTFTDAIGVDPSSYSKIIAGRKPFKAEMAYVASIRFSVPMDYFYHGVLRDLPKNLIDELLSPQGNVSSQARQPSQPTGVKTTGI